MWEPDLSGPWAAVRRETRMSVLIKGGRIVTAADDYVGDVYAENGSVSLIGDGARRLGRQGDRRDRQARHPRSDRPAHAPRDGLRRHRHLRRLHLGHRRRPHSGGRRRWSTSACRRPATRSRRHSRTTTRRSSGRSRSSTSGSTSASRICARAGRSRTSPSCPTRASRPTSSSWPTRARSWSTTRPSSGRWRSPPRPARWSWCTPRTATPSTCSSSRRSPRARRSPSGTPAPGPRLRRGGDEPGDPARPHRRSAAVRRPRLLPGGDRTRSPAPGRRTGRPSARRAPSTCSSTRRRSTSRGSRAAKYVYTPPPRPKENQEHLWRALATGVLSAVSTDHCPFNWDGQKTLGKDDFSKIPNGGPGIENRLHMLHHFGVREGRISLNRFVELVSTNAAKLLRALPAQGNDRVGSDADIVVWDPEKRHTISASTHHSNVDYNLFEGTEVSGRSGGRARAGPGDRRERRARRPARRRPVRQARPLRGGACREGGGGMSDEQARAVYAEAAWASRCSSASAPASSSSTSAAGSPTPRAGSAPT